MRFPVTAAFAPAAILAVAAPVAAPAQDAMAERLRNDPRVEALIPYGQPIAPEVRSDGAVQFGKAIRFRLPGGADVARIGAVSPLLKAVKKGDRIVIAFWARTVSAEGGGPGRIGRVQLEATPAIRTIFAKSFELTTEWKMYQLSGIADADYAPRQLNAALHLNSAKQVLEIGPVFVLDYGQAAS